MNTYLSFSTLVGCLYINRARQRANGCSFGCIIQGTPTQMHATIFLVTFRLTTQDRQKLAYKFLARNVSYAFLRARQTSETFQ